MNLTAADVCNLARVELQDSTKEYWTDQELLDYLNEARDSLYLAVPRLYQLTETVTLAEGTLQTLPNASKRLFAVLDNVTAESKRTVTPINRELLTKIRPSWRGETQSEEIVHFMYTETEPTVYEVWPPADVNVQVRLSYAKPPTKLALASGALPTTDLSAESEMARALQAFVVFKAFAKASDTSPDNGQRSQAAFQLFQALVMGEEAGKRDSSPNTTAIAGKPTEATNR